MELTARKLLQEGRPNDIYPLYCGFLDLTVEEIMDIQKRLLKEQITMLEKSEIGQAILPGTWPRNIEDFKNKIPLTTYDDYASFLSKKNEDALPDKPHCWVRTSGRSGYNEVKWMPYTKRYWSKAAHNAFASMIIGSSKNKGEFLLEQGDKILYALAPRPYTSGEIMVYGMLHHFPFQFLPEPEEAEKMDFFERIEKGFSLSLDEGLDIFYGLASILLAVGKQFSGGSNTGKRNMLSMLKRPKALSRLLKGYIRSKKNKRELLPCDIWDPKILGMAGMDCDIFRDKVKYYWGKNPLEGYGLTEGGIAAIQTWARDGMVFFPDMNFLEFISFEEHLKLKADPTYKPDTLLLDQVQEGEVYELIISNFYGSPLVRYRVGDLIKIVALQDEKWGIKMPHMRFFSRADDLIDIAGFTRLTENIIWKAIEKSEVSYNDWVVRKETAEEKTFVHFYIDSSSVMDKELAEGLIHRKLCELDSDYAQLEQMVGLKPVKVTYLEEGVFQRYLQERIAEGADIAHLKPPRLNPSLAVMEKLQNRSG